MGHKCPFETDKIPRYWQAYIEIAAKLGPSASVCEVGVGPTGGSQLMWQALFPLGHVTGVDHNSPEAVWPEGSRRVVMSQTDAGLPDALGPGFFDLIVDDASHVGAYSSRTFDMLWPLVNPGGYYVIEDWQCDIFHGQWGDAWNQGLWEFVRELPRLLGATSNGPVDSVEFRYGLCIIHRRSK